MEISLRKKLLADLHRTLNELDWKFVVKSNIEIKELEYLIIGPTSTKIVRALSVLVAHEKDEVS